MYTIDTIRYAESRVALVSARCYFLGETSASFILNISDQSGGFRLDFKPRLGSSLLYITSKSRGVIIKTRLSHIDTSTGNASTLRDMHILEKSNKGE
jgi:hypothetical protein